MAIYAYIENNSIVELREDLPKNWKNVSNFYVLSDVEAQQYNWYKIVKVIPDYDSNTQFVDPTPAHSFVDNTVYETYVIKNLPTSIEPIQYTQAQLQQIHEQNLLNQWNIIRTERDKLMSEFEWRYTRYNRQIRLNINPTDDIILLDNYMQALADITTQSDPYNIVWPTYMG